MSRSALFRPGLVQLSLFALVIGLLNGCAKQDKKNPDAAATVSKAPPGDKNPVQIKPAKDETPLGRLHQSFKEAATLDTPDGEERPPDKSFTGKNLPKMNEQIAGVDGKGGLWEQIRFVTPEGKRIRYQALVKTDLGNIHLEFFPDEAPNHVRNFIALAKVGYYDGLPVHRLFSGKVDGKPWTYIEAGCPLGTGDPGYGSIGYWLLPELSDKLTHQEGTLGASHGDTLESAACKFYITLTKAPWMDGNYTIFAKISQGLDVARTISQGPIQEDGFRPKTAVLIREVTVTSTVDDAQVVASSP